MSPGTKGAITGALVAAALLAVILVLGPKWLFMIFLIALGAVLGALIGGNQ